MKSKLISGLLLLAPVCSSASKVDALLEMDLEQILQLDVISIAKKPQSVQKTAAAIHVISQKDIQRSGATTLPEALRGVPGLHVAHLDGNKWAISIRGFNDRFANKLLVLIDGRSVYTPIFSGVYWNMQDIPLTTIERIEVVRGSGGTLWGENAVNGIINIITKNAAATQGTQLSVLAGSQEYIANAMQGGKLGEATNYRVYAKAKKQASFENPGDNNTHTAQDDWENIQAGFRIDGQQDWMLQGAYMYGRADAMVNNVSLNTIPAFSFADKDVNYYQQAHILARSQYQLTENSDLQVQAYYDYSERSHFEAVYAVHTFDLDLQQQYRWGEYHEIMWGAGYRGVLDDLSRNNFAAFAPDQRYSTTYTGFIQDQIQLSDEVSLTLGSKFSRNDYSGFEYQPSARLLWQINSKHSLWTSVTRAVRTPSRVEANIEGVFGVNDPVILRARGNPEQQAEDLLSAEWGYRGMFSDNFSIDIAAFYNSYDDLLTIERSSPVIQWPFVNVPLSAGNKAEAESYGVEIASQWQVLEKWKLSASYSFLKVDARLKAGSSDLATVFGLETADPQQQASLRSFWQLPLDLELNSSVYYTDRIEKYNVKDFVRLDLGLAWKPSKQIELSVVGQNLLASQHKEYGASISGALNTEVPRSVYAKITTRF